MRETTYPHGAHRLKKRTGDNVNMMDGEDDDAPGRWKTGSRSKRRLFYVREERDSLRGQKT